MFWEKNLKSSSFFQIDVFENNLQAACSTSHVMLSRLKFNTLHNRMTFHVVFTTPVVGRYNFSIDWRVMRKCPKIDNPISKNQLHLVIIKRQLLCEAPSLISGVIYNRRRFSMTQRSLPSVCISMKSLDQ